jgi:hypothetical protein
LVHQGRKERRFIDRAGAFLGSLGESHFRSPALAGQRKGGRRPQGSSRLLSDRDGFMCYSLTNIGKQTGRDLPAFCLTNELKRAEQSRNPRHRPAAVIYPRHRLRVCRGLRVPNACFAGVLVNEIGLRP